MKRGGLLTICLLLVSLIPFTAFADTDTQQLESRILETWDDPDNSQWGLYGSKFSAEGFPKKAFPEAYPSALYDLTEAEGKTLRVLGINGSFLRQGYNYIEIVPVEQDAEGNTVPRTISIPGRAKRLDVWVWGSNYNFDLEVHFLDYQEIPHVLKLGNLSFEGWKNLSVNIPSSIRQSQQHLPKFQGLRLTKLVIRTHPTEVVKNFYIYLDQLKVMTDTFESPYDGRDLTNQAKIEEIWGQGGNQ
ncbi:flagellar filament outer layer protein FlaA [Spirochaeta cellobiosiphila]|uniref:flagellar filament outer layer protein FlaA n=1 Tax=Spirochaeta cellobiosiphila TaxID=504483 RepID=UPI0004223E36|nr:flagellar filament outer layer protein FlaA [Spirochaeta cellobiosiphila]